MNAVEPGEPIELMYPPAHLRHILFELFKNAMRATVENRKSALELPEIDVQIAQGHNDISIKISDQGGGISRDINDHLFHYLFSTAPRHGATKFPTKVKMLIFIMQCILGLPRTVPAPHLPVLASAFPSPASTPAISTEI